MLPFTMPQILLPNSPNSTPPSAVIIIFRCTNTLVMCTAEKVNESAKPLKPNLFKN